MAEALEQSLINQFLSVFQYAFSLAWIIAASNLSYYNLHSKLLLFHALDNMQCNLQVSS